MKPEQQKPTQREFIHALNSADFLKTLECLKYYHQDFKFDNSDGSFVDSCQANEFQEAAEGEGLNSFVPLFFAAGQLIEDKYEAAKIVDLLFQKGPIKPNQRTVDNIGLMIKKSCQDDNKNKYLTFITTCSYHEYIDQNFLEHKFLKRIDLKIKDHIGQAIEEGRGLRVEFHDYAQLTRWHLNEYLLPNLTDVIQKYAQMDCKIGCLEALEVKRNSKYGAANNDVQPSNSPEPLGIYKRKMAIQI